jgi:hypothetical protein
MHSAIGRVKMNKVAESDLHPEHIQHECNQFVAFWRAAKRVLLLTPAPDRQAVEWKQRKLKGDKGLRYCSIKPGELERAIAKDIAWLKAHPTRLRPAGQKGEAHMNPKEKEERRAFNEAMRARLKLVAAERNVPDDQMKWIGRLRHDDLVTFVHKHNLSWAWVFCGDLNDRLRMAKRRPSLRVIQGGTPMKRRRRSHRKRNR